MDRWAEETALGEWLRAQSSEGLRALWAIIREFVAWALKRAKAGRVRHKGQLEVFFDAVASKVAFSASLTSRLPASSSASATKGPTHSVCHEYARSPL